MFCKFETQTHGKWVLAGEHAVLRGNAALAFPLKEKELCLDYEPNTSTLKADFEGTVCDELRLLFWSVLEHGQHLCSGSLKQLSGKFQLRSNIPIGVGLGASAALCVAVSRWFASQKIIGTKGIFLFAKELEHLFHGKSSGLDIAAVSSESGVYFQQGTVKTVEKNWHPHWYLSSSEQIGMTSHCIMQVNKLWEKQPSLAQNVDSDMQKAVVQAQAALKDLGSQALHNLKEAIDTAEQCFNTWGLVDGALSAHLCILKDQGALAVKPTGSGSGGYALSLWKDIPPNLPFPLIKL